MQIEAYEQAQIIQEKEIKEWESEGFQKVEVNCTIYCDNCGGTASVDWYQKHEEIRRACCCVFCWSVWNE